MRTEVEAPVTEPPHVGDGVAVAGVRKTYGAVVALDGVDLRVRAREVVAVVGPSGCGKSTLLELVCGLETPDAGTVDAPPAALMPQRDALLPWLSALDNAALARRVAGESRAAARAAAHAHFAAFGLEGFERTRPAALSGGMRQRVAFLRTLLAGRPLLCLDEPFASLDALTRAQAQTWLGEALEREPRTVLLVTHDVEEAVLLADRIVLLSPRPGRVVAELDVRIAAAALAHGPRGGGAARARTRRAGGDRMIAPGGSAARARRSAGSWSCALGGIDPLLLPAPTHVAESLWEDRAMLAPDLLVTGWEALAGLAAAIVGGAAIAVAMHLSPPVDRTLRPLVVGSQAVPIPVVAPLIVFALGFGFAPKILIVALICFFPVVINVADGLRESDPDARKLLRSLDAGRWQRLRFLDAPSALPASFTGMRVAASVAVIGAVFAEWAGSESGLGHLVITANGQLATARAFAATVLLIGMAIALYAAFNALERRFVSWAPRASA